MDLEDLEITEMCNRPDSGFKIPKLAALRSIAQGHTKQEKAPKKPFDHRKQVVVQGLMDGIANWGRGCCRKGD